MTFIARGIIIKKGHSGDYDRQYSIYTSEFGKISALAKGIKRPISKLSSHLDYFSVAELLLAKGNGPYRLAGARIQENFKSIKSNIAKMSAAYLFLEALDNLVVYDHPDGELFELSASFLKSVDDAKNLGELAMVLNKYLFSLLTNLGYQPKIEARNQRQLIGELSRAIIVSSEKELRSARLVKQFLAG